MYNCVKRRFNTLFDKITIYNCNRTDEEIGRYVVIGDIVFAVFILKVSSSVSAWTKSIGVPSPKYDSIFVKDTRNQYEFQVNPYGVFQNASNLPAGTYTVNITYIKN